MATHLPCCCPLGKRRPLCAGFPQPCLAFLSRLPSWMVDPSEEHGCGRVSITELQEPSSLRLVEGPSGVLSRAAAPSAPDALHPPARHSSWEEASWFSASG